MQGIEEANRLFHKPMPFHVLIRNEDHLFFFFFSLIKEQIGTIGKVTQLFSLKLGLDHK